MATKHDVPRGEGGATSSERTVTHATFTLERTFPVPPARAYRAFADAATKKRWFVDTDDWPPLAYEQDFRIGGREHYRGGPSGGPIHRFDALYQDIVPNERIVYTYEMHLGDRRISVSVATLEFLAESGGTQLVLTEQGAFLDGLDESRSRERGTRDLLDALAAELERPQA